MSPLRLARLLAPALVAWSCAASGTETAGPPTPRPDVAPCDSTPTAPAAGEVVRRRPGTAPDTNPAVDCGIDRLPRVAVEQLPESEPVPDRWTLVDALGYRLDWLDPYHGNNRLKADRPVGGQEFFNVSAISATLLEDRQIPSVEAQAPGPGPGQHTLTRGEFFYNQSLTLDAILYRGDTVFRPPDWQTRFTAVLSASGVRSPGSQTSAFTAALQALWYERLLREGGVHDDFDSVRVGIQPLTSDFRGFLLSDQPLAARLFGTRDNNIFQYNLAVFRSFRKNAVSLNAVNLPIPHTDDLLANLYWQDFPRRGLTSEWVFALSHNTEPGTRQVLGSAEQAAGPARHNYDVAYGGYGIDGHLGRLNATAVAYGMVGHEATGTFGQSGATIEAWFAASELSMDFDWRRLRLSLLHASGADAPNGTRATGFAALTANPVFAGTDSSFFIHQQLALAGGEFNLKLRNALLPGLSAAADPAEADFRNPGLDLLGMGGDFTINTQWRVSIDANALWFDQTGALAALLNRASLPRTLGTEFALNAFVRPFTNQNVILRLSNAVLLRGAGYRAVYTGGVPYSTFLFLTVSY